MFWCLGGWHAEDGPTTPTGPRAPARPLARGRETIPPTARSRCASRIGRAPRPPLPSNRAAASRRVKNIPRTRRQRLACHSLPRQCAASSGKLVFDYSRGSPFVIHNPEPHTTRARREVELPDPWASRTRKTVPKYLKSNGVPAERHGHAFREQLCDAASFAPCEGNMKIGVSLRSADHP